MEILVRKYTESNKFKPHYNNATGRYYHTSEDYVKDLKCKGLEPYKPDDVKLPKMREYKPSKWAKGMYQTIKNAKKDKNGGVHLGERFYKELEKKGIDMRRQADLRKLPSTYHQKGKAGKLEGGFYES